jgi:cell division protein FtsB
MQLKRLLGRALRAVAVPSILSALTAFFIWHASHGARGLHAKEERIVEIAAARVELAHAVQERESAERRVSALRGTNIDRDQLEERARALLNLTQREEIIIPYPPSQRLF